MSKKVKIGIVGTGMISRTHIKGYAECPDAEVAAVCDILEERAKKTAEALGVPACTDYRQMFAEAGLDAVSICTPPGTHAPITQAAAEAGLHVLCEKPMSLNATQARQMVEACRKAGVQLGIASARAGRTKPTLQAARDLMQSGRLGRVYYVRQTGLRVRGRPGVDFYHDAPWFIDSDVAGGGALFDMGCYDLDQMLFLLGSPQPVTVSAIAFRGFALPEDFPGHPYDVDEHATLLVRFDNGIGLVLERAWATNVPQTADWKDNFVIFGTEAALKGSQTLCVLKEKEIEEQPIPAPEGEEISAYADFVAAVQENRPPATPGEDGQKVMEILSAALLSAWLRREVTIDDLYAIEALRSLPTRGWPTR